MAHIPGHVIPEFDQALIDAGTAGAAQVERRNPRPTIFDETAQNLFGEIDLKIGGRKGDILGALFGRILPPSAAQKKAFEQLKKERAQKLSQARTGAVSEFAGQAGVSPQTARTASLQVPGLSEGLEQRARNRPGGQEALTGLASQFPRAEATRTLATETAAAAEQRRVTGEQRAVSGEQRAVSAEARAAAVEKRAQAAAELAVERRTDPTSLESMQRVIATEEAASRISGVALPGPGQGIMVSPVTGQPQIVNLEGTAEFAAARKRLQGAQNARRLAAQLQGIVSDVGTGVTGTEFIGPTAVEIGSLRSQLMSAIFQSRGLGAPQGPDIELVEAGLPDPTGFWQNLMAVAQQGLAPTFLNIPLNRMQQQSFVQGFQQAGNEAEQAMVDILMEQPQLINAVDQSLLDPSGQLFGIVEKLRTGN